MCPNRGLEYVARVGGGVAARASRRAGARGGRAGDTLSEARTPDPHGACGAGPHRIRTPPRVVFALVANKAVRPRAALGADVHRPVPAAVDACADRKASPTRRRRDLAAR